MSAYVICVGGVLLSLAVMDNLQLFVYRNSGRHFGVFAWITVSHQGFVDTQSVRSTSNDGVHDRAGVAWKPGSLRGSDIANLCVTSTAGS